MAANCRKRVIQSVETEDVCEFSQDEQGSSTEELSEEDSSYCDLSTSTSATGSSTGTSTRKSRMAMKKQRYLSGTSRKPYRISNELQKALSDNEQGLSSNQAMASHQEPSQWNENVCKSCAPVLQKYADTFRDMKRQGSELKRRKLINPHPKRPSTEQYRDLVKQNEWIRNNIFDATGNYLFCCRCVHHGLGISFQRLSRQRKVKRKQFSEPLRSFTKSEVISKSLGKFVVMPESCDMSFMAWWKLLDNSSIVTVQYPHERHGLAGSTSHAAKVDAKQDFLNFVDINSQPNGRSAESSSATHYFLPKFRTIQTPKANVSNYELRVKQSLVGEFNRAQTERHRTIISNYSASVWLKKERPKYAIYPHKLDYCDTCAKQNELLRSKQTILNRIRQTGSAEEEQQKSIEDEMAQINEELKTHREQAQQSHDYYKDVTSRCHEEWKEIFRLETKHNKSDDETQTLEKLRHNFTAVLSVDFQMQKLLPYWGLSPQPGSTYYLQKLSHDIFGIVDHREDHSTLYIFNETVGPKNTDHTISLLMDYIRNHTAFPSWIKRLHIFLDNTGSTNKNAFFMGWGMEIIQQKCLDYLRFSFLVAGHTKFDVDRVFSITAKTFHSSDVFNTNELVTIMSQPDQITAKQVKGNVIYNWREKISAKYSKLPGIRELHDFIIVRPSDTEIATMLVREWCYGGTPKRSPLKLNSGFTANVNVFPSQSECYDQLKKTRQLTVGKLTHLTQMCQNFIAEERWLECVTKTNSN